MPTAKGVRVNDSLARLKSKYGSKLLERGSDVSPETTIYELHGKGTREIQFSVNAARAGIDSRSPTGAAARRSTSSRRAAPSRGPGSGRASSRRARLARARRAAAPAQLLVLDLALELLQRAAQVAADRAGGDALGEPAEDARARDAVREAQLDPRAAPPPRSRRRQRPRWSMPVTDVQARSRSARELDDLDQAADLGRADAQQHPVAGAEAVAWSPTTSQRVTPDMKCR